MRAPVACKKAFAAIPAYLRRAQRPPATNYDRKAQRIGLAASVSGVLLGIYLPHWYQYHSVSLNSSPRSVALSSGFLYLAVRALTETSYLQRGYTAAFFAIVGFSLVVIPQYAVGWQFDPAMMALGGFYAGLFTWFFNLMRKPLDSYQVFSEGRIAATQCKLVADYYMALLKLLVVVFGAVTITLAWHIADQLNQASRDPIQGASARVELIYLFAHDIFGSAWLLLGIGGIAVSNYFEVARRAGHANDKSRSDLVSSNNDKKRTKTQ
jgi:hypothetical protein